ncbi:hypothetical protein E2562_028904 [Oryza meyeriana var. granulata]|uniref:Uncharacterized protein n=1 Tax=Oryza meyeriana var. granulata TaxID=110450 RepID=A0A6G1FD85_9ORYZ|nr:hypothetical protein E2562_028904 [Oryza meyeriana var. granulata]
MACRGPTIPDASGRFGKAYGENWSGAWESRGVGDLTSAALADRVAWASGLEQLVADAVWAAGARIQQTSVGIRVAQHRSWGHGRGRGKRLASSGRRHHAAPPAPAPASVKWASDSTALLASGWWSACCCSSRAGENRTRPLDIWA